MSKLNELLKNEKIKISDCFELLIENKKNEIAFNYFITYNNKKKYKLEEGLFYDEQFKLEENNIIFSIHKEYDDREDYDAIYLKFNTKTKCMEAYFISYADSSIEYDGSYLKNKGILKLKINEKGNFLEEFNGSCNINEIDKKLIKTLYHLFYEKCEILNDFLHNKKIFNTDYYGFDDWKNEKNGILEDYLYGYLEEFSYILSWKWFRAKCLENDEKDKLLFYLLLFSDHTPFPFFEDYVKKYWILFEQYNGKNIYKLNSLDFVNAIKRDYSKFEYVEGSWDVEEYSEYLKKLIPNNCQLLQPFIEFKVKKHTSFVYHYILNSQSLSVDDFIKELRKVKEELEKLPNIFDVYINQNKKREVFLVVKNDKEAYVEFKEAINNDELEEDIEKGEYANICIIFSEKINVYLCCSNKEFVNNIYLILKQNYKRKKENNFIFLTTDFLDVLEKLGKENITFKYIYLITKQIVIIDLLATYLLYCLNIPTNHYFKFEQNKIDVVKERINEILHYLRNDKIKCLKNQKDNELINVYDLVKEVFNSKHFFKIYFEKSKIVLDMVENVKTIKDFCDLLAICCFDIDKHYNSSLNIVENIVIKKTKDFNYYSNFKKEEVRIYSTIWKDKIRINNKEIEFFDGFKIEFYQKPYYKIKRMSEYN